MGTVYAKERPIKLPTMANEVIPDFHTVPAHVQKVIVDGLGRTKDDIVVREVQAVFSATNLKDVIQKSFEVKMRLERLGLFKSVGIFVDTSKGDKAAPEGYQVTFDVRELRRMTGSINTMIGNNDASLRFCGRLPNILGRGERLQAEYTHGTKQTRGHNVVFMKPINGNPDVIFSSGIYQFCGDYPWSGYKEIDRGIAFDLTFPTILGSHNIKWEGVWRDLRSLSRTTAFAVREQAGQSIKSCFKHILIRDHRDDPVLPSKGTLLRATHEYAGLGGNVDFMKQDVEFQINYPLWFDTVLQLSVAAGVMKSLRKNTELRINDKFFLGGPLTLRGFTIKGLGPHSDGNALGADTYWLGALHLYTPLPFRPGKGGFGDLFRTHLFVSAGNLANMGSSQNTLQDLLQLAQAFRWSYGGGIVLRMGGMARLELNYVVPMRAQRGDSVNPGLQFGIGLTFL